MLTVERTKLSDVDECLPIMRDKDRMELLVSQSDPYMMLEESIKCSTEAFTWRDERGIVAIAGLAPEGFLPKRACPWIITTTNIAGHELRFVKETKRFVVWANEVYPVLYNYVWDEYEEAKRWLKCIGFELGTRIKLGNGHFIEVVRRA